MIVVVDYGIGNLGSVTKALVREGADARLSGDPGEVRAAAALVLPGDGAFGAAMDELEARGLASAVRESARAGTPLLGICVGMQMLFDEGEEHGRRAGLGLLPGRVVRLAGPAFEGPRGLPLPHMGWNRLALRRSHPLVDGIADGSHVYFVHSYHCLAAEADVVATTDYGGRLAAVVARGEVWGVQFHPEKSQAVGLAMVRGFVEHVRSRASAAAAVRRGA